MMWLLACAGDPAPTDRTGGGSSGPTGHTGESSPPGCSPATWYQDADGDGLGGPSTTTACAAPDGWVAAGGDCDDGDPALDRPLDDRRLVDASADAGFVGVGVNWDGVTHPCFHEADAGGGAVGDVDGDGDLDVFLSRLYDEDVLLLNDGLGHFTVDPSFRGSWDPSNGALLVDVDGDRDLDLYVTRVGQAPNFLYLNDGAGHFVEDGDARGAWMDPRPECSDTFGPSAADVDGDGDLDLFVAGWTEKPNLGTRRRTGLLLNDGTGRFVDATAASGVDALWDRAPFSGKLADADGDGDLDLFAVSDWGLTTILTNDGAGRFAPVADESVFTDDNGMGQDLGDVDGDGNLDWFVTAVWQQPCDSVGEGWGCTGNRLYLGDGRGGWVDGTDRAGVREGQWGWGAALFDQDQDGILDLVMTGGMTISEFTGLTGRFWRGLGDGRFEDRTCEVGWVRKGQGRSVVPFDADGDGDLDLLGIGAGEEPVLWRNVGSEDRASLIVTLDQPGTQNRWGIGARVRVAGQVRWITAEPSFVAGRPSMAHFGLGDHHDPVDVEVTWPDGATTTFPSVSPGTVLLSRP